MNLQEIDITTPEHVQLRFKIAGIGSRATAQVIDWFILGLINFTIFFIAIKLQDSFIGDITYFSEYMWAIIIVVFFVLTWGYFAFLEFFNAGRTIGKWLMGIRVIQDNGQSITFLSAFLRNVLRIVDFLPGMYLLGMIMIFVHPKHKRIGDLVGGTIVIYERKRKKSKMKKDLESVDATRITIDDWARTKITTREWELLKTYISRRQTLGELDREQTTMKVAGILFPIIGHDYGGKPATEVELDLMAMYMIIRKDWEF
ncbi:RDD family protein [Pseudoneobacillus sp. C159]